MSLFDTIILLIEVNKKHMQEKDNKELIDKKNKLKYYFLLSLKNSPEKAIVVNNYLDNILKKMEKRNLINNQYIFINQIKKEVETLYLTGLKNLTLNQKKKFFEKKFTHLLYEKDNDLNEHLSNKKQSI